MIKTSTQPLEVEHWMFESSCLFSQTHQHKEWQRRPQVLWFPQWSAAPGGISRLAHIPAHNKHFLSCMFCMTRPAPPWSRRRGRRARWPPPTGWRRQSGGGSRCQGLPHKLEIIRKNICTIVYEYVIPWCLVEPTAAIDIISCLADLQYHNEATKDLVVRRRFVGTNDEHSLQTRIP